MAGIFSLSKCEGLWYNTVTIESEVEKALMKKRWKRLGLGIAASAAAAGIALGIYAGDYYRADEEALAALVSDAAVEVELLSDGAVFASPGAKTGLIFYPGGKVEHTAYAPLMRTLAEEGVLCVVPQMPLNLAVLDMNAAEGWQERYPQVEEWYIGGHSLGGAMAASCAAKHGEDYKGLLLLAAYSTADLTGTDLEVCSVYGSSDGVLNMEKYEQYRANLPEDAVEIVLDGGCHACFGSYGPQTRDGAHTMTAEEQTHLTAQLFLQNIQ